MAPDAEISNNCFSPLSSYAANKLRSVVKKNDLKAIPVDSDSQSDPNLSPDADSLLDFALSPQQLILLQSNLPTPRDLLMNDINAGNFQLNKYTGQGIINCEDILSSNMSSSRVNESELSNETHEIITNKSDNAIDYDVVATKFKSTSNLGKLSCETTQENIERRSNNTDELPDEQELERFIEDTSETRENNVNISKRIRNEITISRRGSMKFITPLEPIFEKENTSISENNCSSIPEDIKPRALHEVRHNNKNNGKRKELDVDLRTPDNAISGDDQSCFSPGASNGAPLASDNSTTQLDISDDTSNSVVDTTVNSPTKSGNESKNTCIVM